MKEYDFIFSLGFSCGNSQALRAAGLQSASFPLDWLGIPDLKTAVDAMVNDFAHWVDPESMRLIDVCHGPGFGTRIYLNETTQLGFSHEFPDTKPFAESQPKVRATYERRAERFRERLQTAHRILAVYVEHSTHARLERAELVAELERLRRQQPDATVDLLYFFEQPGMREPQVVADANGITEVAADYRKFENGVVTQYVDVAMLTAYFRAHLSVSRSAARTADTLEYEATMKKVSVLRWGPDKSRFRRWLNHHAYKFYRTLEKYLQQRGLIHDERPVWFWEHQ